MLKSFNKKWSSFQNKRTQENNKSTPKSGLFFTEKHILIFPKTVVLLTLVWICSRAYDNGKKRKKQLKKKLIYFTWGATPSSKHQLDVGHYTNMQLNSHGHAHTHTEAGEHAHAYFKSPQYLTKEIYTKLFGLPLWNTVTPSLDGLGVGFWYLSRY